MRQVRWLVVLTAALVVLVGCVPPGNPGTEQRNQFLEANAGSYAIALGVTVQASANPDGPDDYNRCANIVNPNIPGWLSGATLQLGNGTVHVCYTLTLPTHDATRGSVYMHEVGHAYGFRLTARGHSIPGGPANGSEEFANCFSHMHGGNHSCSATSLNKLGALESSYPPNDSNGWWTP